MFLKCFDALLRYLYTSFKHFWISSTSVGLLVGLLPYWKETNEGISPVLNTFEIFFGCWCTNFNLFLISCMSVSLFVSSLHYWSKVNIGKSSVLDEISSWNIFWHSWDTGTLIQNNNEFLVWLLVCHLAHFFTEINL